MPSQSRGLRGYHFRLLAALDQYGPSSQAELGRHTGIDRSDVVAALNELVDGGLARRRADPADGRRNVVTITRRGSSTLERLDAALDGVQDALLEPLVAERAHDLRATARGSWFDRGSERARWYALGSHGGVAQPGRALRSQRRSRGFKSHHLHSRKSWSEARRVFPGRSGFGFDPASIPLSGRKSGTESVRSSLFCLGRGYSAAAVATTSPRRKPCRWSGGRA